MGFKSHTWRIPPSNELSHVDGGKHSTAGSDPTSLPSLPAPSLRPEAPKRPNKKTAPGTGRGGRPPTALPREAPPVPAGLRGRRPLLALPALPARAPLPLRRATGLPCPPGTPRVPPCPPAAALAALPPRTARPPLPAHRTPRIPRRQPAVPRSPGTRFPAGSGPAHRAPPGSSRRRRRAHSPGRGRRSPAAAATGRCRGGQPAPSTAPPGRETSEGWGPSDALPSFSRAVPGTAQTPPTHTSEAVGTRRASDGSLIPRHRNPAVLGSKSHQPR